MCVLRLWRLLLSVGRDPDRASTCYPHIHTLNMLFSFLSFCLQSLCFCPHSRLLLSLGRDPERALVVWDLKSAVAQHRSAQAQEEKEQCVACKPPPFVRSHVAGVCLCVL